MMAGECAIRIDVARQYVLGGVPGLNLDFPPETPSVERYGQIYPANDGLTVLPAKIPSTGA